MSNEKSLTIMRTMAHNISRMFELDDAMDQFAEAVFATVSIESTEEIISTLQKLLKKHQKEMAEADL